METTQTAPNPTQSSQPLTTDHRGGFGGTAFEIGSIDIDPGPSGPGVREAFKPLADPWVGGAAAGLGLGAYVRLVRRYKLLIMAVVALTTSAAIAKIIMAPKVYMATTTILPSGGQTSGGMMSLLASMTGMPPMINGGGENSSALFPRILESRVLSLELLESQFNYVKNDVPQEGTLLEYLEAKTPDEALLALKGIRAVDVDKEMGIITVSVSTPEAQLSTQIANRSVELLERFNRESRQLSASENSSFIQERLEKIGQELTQAEELLVEFREQNMRTSSPDLDVERLRLERAVALKSQVYVTLNNQAEIARVEEAKNLPIVRVLDRAVEPQLPVLVPKLVLLAAGSLGGLVLALILIAGLEFLKSLKLEAAKA